MAKAKKSPRGGRSKGKLTKVAKGREAKDGNWDWSWLWGLTGFFMMKSPEAMEKQHQKAIFAAFLAGRIHPDDLRAVPGFAKARAELDKQMQKRAEAKASVEEVTTKMAEAAGCSLSEWMQRSPAKSTRGAVKETSTQPDSSLAGASADESDQSSTVFFRA